MGAEASQRQSYAAYGGARRPQSMPPQSYDDRRDGPAYYTPASVPTPAPVPMPPRTPPPNATMVQNTPAPPTSAPLPPIGLPLPPRTPPPPNATMMDNRFMESVVYVTNPETETNAVGSMDQRAFTMTPQPQLVYPSYPVCNSPCSPTITSSSSAQSSQLSDPNAYGIDDPNYVDRYRVINGVRLALPRRKSELPTSAEVFRSFGYYIPG